MEQPDIVPVYVATITGIFALILSLIAIIERRADKRAAAKLQEKQAEFAKITEASNKHIKEIADEIAEQYRQRVSSLEQEVTILKGRVAELEKELISAYAEIKRLKCRPPPRKRQPAKQQ